MDTFITRFTCVVSKYANYILLFFTIIYRKGIFFNPSMFPAPISNISIEGTNWIQPWKMLSLNVTCKGSGPMLKCLQFHRGKYNMTGNETCEIGNIEHLRFCNFPILHFFLEPSVYTILIILDNEVSKQIYPVTVNIYKGKFI